jgi:hypothetical protein
MFQPNERWRGGNWLSQSPTSRHFRRFVDFEGLVALALPRRGPLNMKLN